MLNYKFILSLAAVFTLTLNSSVARPNAATPKVTSLPWQFDLKQALAQSKLKHKLVIVDVFTDNCHWCKRMDTETFQNPGVVSELANHFVWAKINARTSADLKPYKIEGFPTVLVLDGHGKLITSFSGYIPPEQFVEKMGMLSPN